MRARDPLAALNRLGAGPAIEYARQTSGTVGKATKATVAGSSVAVDSADLGAADADRAPREPRRRLNMSAAMGANGTETGASALGSVRTSSAASLSNASQLANSSRAGGSSRAPSSRTSGRGSRAESDGDDTPRHALNPGVPADEIQTEFRERLWGYLLNNMVRAVDEVYILCELEGGESETAAALALLKESVDDFASLAARLRDQERFTGVGSISWDVGRTDARPDPRHAEMISALTGYPTPPASAKGSEPIGTLTRNPKPGTKISISDVEDVNAIDTDARHARTTSGEGKGDGEWQTAGRGGKAVTTHAKKTAGDKAGDSNKNKNNSNKNKNKREKNNTTRAIIF